MTDTKYTPAPWRVETSPFEVYNVDHGALGTKHIVSGSTMIAHLYDDAQADLIASAPELLGALEYCVHIMTEFGSFDNGVETPCGSIKEAEVYAGESIKEARNAIAKAKGEV
jgi:hypothetical protein